jgi:hypothetical protein
MMFDTRAVQCALTPFNSLVLQEEMSSGSAIMRFELHTRLRRFAQLVLLLPDYAPRTVHRRTGGTVTSCIGLAGAGWGASAYRLWEEGGAP